MARPLAAASRLELGALVGCQVGEDEPGDAGRAQPAQDRAAVAATQQLVDVAHAHDGRAGPGVGHSLDERQRTIERGARGQCDATRPLERRAVREGVGVRQAELEQVRARIDEPQRDAFRDGRVRVPGHGVRDERRASVRLRPRANASPMRRAPAVVTGAARP